jgi:ribulose-phosphate 3-epimerase
VNARSPGIRIAPSLLSADFARLGEAVAACEAGGAEAIHFDVMDGHFVPNLTVGPLVLAALRKGTSVPFDVHLMIEEPLRTVEQYLDAGASRVSAHVEAEPHLHRFCQVVRSRGASPGVAINPGTSLGAIEEALLHVDFVLVMTVNPGWGGQRFIPESLGRIERLAKLVRGSGREVEIAVDGGVTDSNALEIAAAGAGFLVAGSAVFGAPDPASRIGELRRLALGGKLRGPA